MELVLPSPLRAPYEAGRDLNVVISCQDKVTTLRTCAVLGLLERHLHEAGRLVCRWWDFEILGIHALRELASREAAAADIVMIGIHEGRELPEMVDAWMKRWLELRKDRPGALVALLEPSLEKSNASPGIQLQLRQAAALGHLDYFGNSSLGGEERGGIPWISEAARQYAKACMHNVQPSFEGADSASAKARRPEMAIGPR
jgi:hypothetical protein